ncbi:MAG: hypothetical protein RI920_811 [Pseudomonadota bacterium]
MLRERNQFNDSMQGQFSLGGRLWRGGDEAGGRLGEPEGHGVTIGNEDITHAVGARAGRQPRKAAPKERMGGISDLDFWRVV